MFPSVVSILGGYDVEQDFRTLYGILMVTTQLLPLPCQYSCIDGICDNVFKVDLLYTGMITVK